VLAVNDFSRYTAFGGQSGLDALAAHTVSVLNAVTTIYRALVGLTGRAPFFVSPPEIYPDKADQAVLLEDFLTWSSAQMAAGSLPENDNRVYASVI
ncbi:YPTC6, partial [Symbiodinium pilosum]